MMKKSLCVLFCVSTVAIFTSTLAEKSDGVFDKIKVGLEYATNYLEAAKDIADLVAKSLGSKQHQRGGEASDAKEKGNFGPSNIVSAFFRLIGLNSQKVTAIAVNSVIFLAQMISSLFELKPPKGNIARSLDDVDGTLSWNPTKLIIDSQNERIQRLVEQAQDERLSNQLVERVDDIDSACIRLLLCKTSPVIKAAQNFLKNKTHGKTHRMTSWLPSRDEFEENSDHCENTHVDCNLFS
ncbi:uncharacterized protein LOC143181407 [Calliopsis andreniformis]|uniref:uncharacterized protein LOC143181407 n=1 Tax=Calliopsis andreniformis TaxID=337506 RepID=UPI003FCCE21D